MNHPVVVQIIGAPAGVCGGGVQDTWRQAAGLVGNQLRAYFGVAVQVDYFDLLDTGCPPLPDGVQLPVVLVNGILASSGGRLSVPAIRRRLEALGMRRNTHKESEQS